MTKTKGVRPDDVRLDDVIVYQHVAAEIIRFIEKRATTDAYIDAVYKHRIAEDIAYQNSLPDGVKYPRVRDTIATAFKIPSVAPVPNFDFSFLADVEPDERNVGLIELSGEMIQKGDFVLPFPQIWIAQENGATFMSEVPSQEDPNETEIVGCVYARDMTKKFQEKLAGFAPLYAIANFQTTRDHCKKGSMPVQVRVLTDTADFGLSLEQMGKTATTFLWDAFLGIMLLMSRGTTIEVLPADKKVNRFRKDRKKPPISDIYRVKVPDPDADKVVREHQGGTHARPRLHYRRGHYRRIDGRMIPVMHHLVGGREGDVMPELGKMMYEVMKKRIKARPLEVVGDSANQQSNDTNTMAPDA